MASNYLYSALLNLCRITNQTTMGHHLTLVTMHIKKNSEVMIEFEQDKGIFIDLLMKWKPVTVMVHNSLDSLKDRILRFYWLTLQICQGVAVLP